MRDFSAPCRCVRGSHTVDECGPRKGKHGAPLSAGPTRRPPTASATMSSSSTPVSSPSCSHTQTQAQTAARRGAEEELEGYRKHALYASPATAFLVDCHSFFISYLLRF